MSVPFPTWPPSSFFDHGLKDEVDLFVDESGPRQDGTLTLGVLLVEHHLARAAEDRLDNLGDELEKDHPALASPAYEGEWKGRLLARSVASKKERRAVGRGELLSDVGRQAVYARCLDSVRQMPGARAFALTYRWTGPVKGPDGIDGYRVQRAIGLALSALEFQVVRVRHIYIDDGHATHYTDGIAAYADATGFQALPHTFVVSTTDRRIQVADLIAFAAHASRFPGGSRVFPTAQGWLAGFVGDRLIRASPDPDHHQTEA